MDGFIGHYISPTRLFEAKAEKNLTKLSSNKKSPLTAQGLWGRRVEC